MRTDIFSHSRHPFQIYILGLCIITSLPTVLGARPAPGTITEVVPYLMVVLWSWSLLGGSVMGLLGAVWRNRATGLIVEQVGLLLAGLACLFYAAVIGYYTYQRGGLISAGLIGGFGISCLVRSWQIQKYLGKVHKVVRQVRSKSRAVDPEDIKDIGSGV